MSVTKYDRSERTSTEYSRITTLWDGTLLKKEISSKEENAEFPYKFALPKRYIAKTNQFLEKNYLPQLWAGGNCAFWYPVGRWGSFYMGTLNVSTENFSDEVEHLKEICNINSGAVLVAYTCFSILKPFFSSYHQLDRQSPYLKVKRHIEGLVAVNIRNCQPEDTEKLVKCCCGYFDPGKKYIVEPVIDGINILSNNAKQSKLSVDEFEWSILQPACVLWLNRIPAEELAVSGRIIDLEIDDLPFGGEVADISRYLVTSLSNSLSRGPLDVTQRRTFAVTRFIDRIEDLAKKHAISLKDIDLDDKLRKIIESETYSLIVERAKSLVFCVKCMIPEFMSPSPWMEQFEINNNQAFMMQLNELLLLFKKELNIPYDISSQTKPHYQSAISKFRRNALTHSLDKRIIRKIAYLSASFQIFAELCLPEEDQRPLIEKVDGALISTIVKQIGLESAQDILERYLISLIENGQYARIRGTHKNGEGIAVWYDPTHDIFLLPAGTYFLHVKSSIDVRMEKSRFEDALVQDGIIYDVSRRTSDREQKRRTFECVLVPGEKKVSVLKILRANLSKGFTENDSIRQAIEEMRSDPAPLRSRRG